MLNNEQTLRYGRHLIMPEVGREGQEKLMEAKVLLVGAGGLGSPSALYLAASGVGELTIIDPDVVDVSNLQRQIIHSTSSIGQPKAISAQERIAEVNPNVKVNTIVDAFTADNARQLVREHDIVVDGTDNFQTRYLTNDACVLEGKPNVYGSIFRFDGQVSVFRDPNGPCYRCLYPEAPPAGMVPSCAEGGVLGVLPGVVGVMQATEAIKLTIGKGNPLIGRLLIYNALEMSFKTLKVRKDPECPICAAKASITEIDPANYADISCGDPVPQGVQIDAVTATQLAERLQNGSKPVLLDVRTHQEWQINRLPEAKHIPLDELTSRMNELDTAESTVVYCHHGNRSKQAIALLQKVGGFRKLENLAGGIDAWSVNVDSTVPRY